MSWFICNIVESGVDAYEYVDGANEQGSLFFDVDGNQIITGVDKEHFISRSGMDENNLLPWMLAYGQ